LDVHTETDRRHGHRYVGEQNRGVDAITANGLERELGGKLRVTNGFEDADIASRTAVFG
jgi:methionine synthase II (cobalamin-independent)